MRTYAVEYFTKTGKRLKFRQWVSADSEESAIAKIDAKAIKAPKTAIERKVRLLEFSFATSA